MVSVLKGHPRYTIQSVQQVIKPQSKLYDQYDKSNDADAQEFLLDSLDPDLAIKLSRKIKQDELFPVVFIRLIQLIKPSSVHHFDQLKNAIKQQFPSNYPGEDISLMAADMKDDADELLLAGQYDHNLNTVMVDNFLQASNQEHNSYRHKLLGVSEKLEQELVTIGYMDKATATQHLESCKLTYEDICETAEDAYRSLLNKSQWTPAKAAIRDSKKPPAAFGNAAMCMSKEDFEARFSG